MLSYLEDYLEREFPSVVFDCANIWQIISFVLVIEHLPSELRDRFTDLREMDLAVQSKFLS